MYSDYKWSYGICIYIDAWKLRLENKGLYSFLICSFFLVKTFVSAYIWFLLKNAKCYSEQTQTVTRKTPITHISSNSYFRVWIISQTTFNVLEKLLQLARPRTASHWWVWVACLKWHRNTLYHWLLWIHSVQLSKLSPFLVFYFLIWNLGIRHSSFSRLLGINVASRILCGIHQKVVLFFYFKFSHNSPSDPPLKDNASQATPLSDSSAQSKESSSLSKCTFPCPYLMFKSSSEPVKSVRLSIDR